MRRYSDDTAGGDEQEQNFELSGGGSGANRADFANSGIHGPAATVAPRVMGEAASRYREYFHDVRAERCLLCDERITSWAGHVVFVSHQARLGILERVLSGMCGPPDFVVRRWWDLLNMDDPDGINKVQHAHRIPQLSSWSGSKERKSRLQYLLRFLQGNGILKVSLGVYNDGTREFGRSNVFERFEMVGDNVVKAVFFDRLQQLVPAADGGAGGKLSMIQQLIDSNEGLLQAYDYLGMDAIIGSNLSNSKFKSDVMEALFGELQSYLWAATQLWDSSPVEYTPPLNAASGPEMKYVIAIVQHTLLELTDVMLMYAVESTVVRAKKLLQQEYKASRNPKPLPNPYTLTIPGALSSSSATGAGNNMRRQSSSSSSVSSAADLSLMSADDFFVALDRRNEVRPFLGVGPHGRMDAATVEATQLRSDAAARMVSSAASIMAGSSRDGDSGASSSSSSSSSSASFSSSVGVNVLKSLSQRLAEEKHARAMQEASWKIRPVPLFSPASDFAALDEEESGYVKQLLGMRMIEFTEGIVDAAPLTSASSSSSSSSSGVVDGMMEEPDQPPPTAAALQKPATLCHIDKFCDRQQSCPDGIGLREQMRQSDACSLSLQLKPSAEPKSHLRNRRSVNKSSWWNYSFTSCPWSPATGVVLGSTALPAPAPQPPLEAAAFVWSENHRQQHQQSDDDDGANAMLQSRRRDDGTEDYRPDREEDLVIAAIHRACADDISRELTPKQDPDECHDFDFSQLRPAPGKLVWN